MRSQIAARVDTPTVGEGNEELAAQSLRPEDLPRWIGVGNGMLATWTVGYRANSDDLLKQFRASPFDVIIVQSVPDGFNDLVRRGLTAAVAESKLWDRNRGYTPPVCADEETQCDAALLGYDKSVHEMMSNTFAVIHRKKVKNVIVVEYAVAPAPPQDAAVAEMVTSRSRWGLAQLGTVSLSFQTTKQRMSSIKMGVVYRQGDWKDQP